MIYVLYEKKIFNFFHIPSLKIISLIIKLTTNIAFIQMQLTSL